MIRPDRWKYTVTQLYKGKAHGGVDIAPSKGKPTIYAPASGKVVQVSSDSISGKYIVIKSRFRYHFLGHLSKVSVKVGQKVKEDQAVGNFGDTGKATGVHVHWEIWYQLWKRFVMNPLKVLERRKNKELYRKYTR